MKVWLPFILMNREPVNEKLIFFMTFRGWAPKSEKFVKVRKTLQEIFGKHYRR